MKIGQEFKEIGNLEKGELILKFPGTDLKMPYENSKVFLSDNGIGYISLAIRDAYCQENGEAQGLMGALGRELAEQINDPDIKPLLKEALSVRDHSLFYSRSKDNTEILCIPGMTGEYTIDENLEDLIVATYSTQGEIPTPEKIYAHHMSAIGNRQLITDKNILEKEVMQLVSKTNAVFEKALEKMNDFGF